MSCSRFFLNLTKDQNFQNIRRTGNEEKANQSLQLTDIKSVSELDRNKKMKRFGWWYCLVEL